ncbi:MAG: phosphatase PAP2 family protein [Gemmatimonadota bacterium]
MSQLPSADSPDLGGTQWAPLHYALLFVITISFYLTILLDLAGTWSWIAVTLALGAVALAATERTTRILAVYPLVFLFYVAGRRLADDGFAPVRVEYVISADRVLGLGEVPTVWLQHAMAGVLAGWAPVLVAIYVSFFFVFVASAPFLYWRDRSGAERMLAAGVLVFVIGLPIHWALPTAPPWMASLEGYIEPVGRLLHDGWLGEQTTVYELGNSASGNDVSAMPSYHMALTVLVALAWGRSGSVRAAIGWAYVALMGFALVYGAEHYVVDLLVGGAVAAVAWRYAPGLLARLGSTQAPVGGVLETDRGRNKTVPEAGNDLLLAETSPGR